MFEDGSEGAIIPGSPDLIIQMLDKLVDNAVDFSREGDVIAISLDRVADELILESRQSGTTTTERYGVTAVPFDGVSSQG